MTASSESRRPTAGDAGSGDRTQGLDRTGLSGAQGTARRQRVQPVLLVGLGATIVSAVGSWSVSLWSDEAATISAASRSVGDLGRLVATVDAVHATYYLLMHGWILLFGASPFSLRLLSALAVGVAASGVYVLARRLSNSTTALLAAVVFALLPRITWAGIEARPFALGVALAVWLTVVLHVAVARRTARWWTGYAVLLSVGTAVNLYVILLAGAHGVTLLADARTRPILRAFVPAALGGLLLASPVVTTALGQGGQLGLRDLGPVGVARNVVVNQWFLGETPTATTTTSATLTDVWGPGGLWKVSALLLALVCWTLIAWFLARARDGRGRRATPRPTGRPAPFGELVRWALPWLVLPTAVVAAAWLVSPSVYNARYFGFCAPALALLLAAALRSLPRRGTITVGIALCLLVVPVYASQRGVHAKSGADWSLVAAHLEGRTGAGDAVYFGPRDDFVDGQVKRSLRAVSLAYPAPFEGLRDVTLLSSPEEGATLFGTSVPLTDSLDRLDGVTTLWVLRRQDRPEHAAAEDRLLGDLGFAVVEVWDGPQTEVVELGR